MVAASASVFANALIRALNSRTDTAPAAAPAQPQGRTGRPAPQPTPVGPAREVATAKVYTGSQALVEVCTRVAAGLPAGSRVVPGAVEVLGPEGGFAAVEGSLAVTAGLLA